MTVQIIETKAENVFLAAHDLSHTEMLKHSALYCNFARIKLAPTPLSLLPIMTDVLQNKDATAYFCYDGDVIITWEGFHDSIYKGLTTMLGMMFKNKCSDALLSRVFVFYEPYQEKEELRAICRGKLVQRDVEQSKTQSVQTPKAARPPAPSVTLAFTPEQLVNLNEALNSRHLRKGGEILIVDDHAYVTEMLTTMLGQRYRCRAARSLNEAMQLYSIYAADICLIDTGLPDGNGHDLARLLKTSDPKSILIMLSGATAMADINRAKENQVHAFIIKPFSKNKVLDTVAACLRNKDTPRASASA